MGDRTLGMYINHEGDLVFDTYSYANDWSGLGVANVESSQETSNDLFDWVFIYFGVDLDTNIASYHVRFKDHIAT
jgi:hypothetical protein